jgi:hypothetical protein
MKKLMSLMLGMALTFTTVAVVFAQDTAAPKKEETKKEKKSPKKSKKDTAAPAPKKEGR